MAVDNEGILQRAVAELAESTGVDPDSVASVLSGLGLRDTARLDEFRRPATEITARDLHISVDLGDIVVSY